MGCRSARPICPGLSASRAWIGSPALYQLAVMGRWERGSVRRVVILGMSLRFSMVLILLFLLLLLPRRLRRLSCRRSHLLFLQMVSTTALSLPKLQVSYEIVF